MSKYASLTIFHNKQVKQTTQESRDAREGTSSSLAHIVININNIALVSIITKSVICSIVIRILPEFNGT